MEISLTREASLKSWTGCSVNIQGQGNIKTNVYNTQPRYKKEWYTNGVCRSPFNVGRKPVQAASGAGCPLSQ